MPFALSLYWFSVSLTQVPDHKTGILLWPLVSLEKKIDDIILMKKDCIISHILKTCCPKKKIITYLFVW